MVGLLTLSAEPRSLPSVEPPPSLPRCDSARRREPSARSDRDASSSSRIWHSGQALRSVIQPPFRRRFRTCIAGWDRQNPAEFTAASPSIGAHIPSLASDV